MPDPSRGATVRWSAQSVAAGVTTVALLLSGAPAVATSGDAPPGGSGQAHRDPRGGSPLDLTDLTDLPVEAHDVTDSDTNLGSAATEVTVLVEDDSGGPPTVAKLRADSPGAAADLVEHLDAEPGVVAAPTSVLRSFRVAATDPMTTEQWNLPMVGAPEAWATTQGAGVIVAVVDSGVDGTHPDLAARMLPEIDLLPESTPTPDQNAHGTGVASLVAASLDGAGMAGVAPQVSILPVSALDPAGIGDSSTVARAIIAAADAGARVVNLSLGGPDRDPVLDRACAYAYSRGAVVVAAAGNTFQFGNDIQYPAASPDVVAVASMGPSGNPSGFSNTGPHVAIAAPGEDVLAAVPGGGFLRQSGTSFAAPHVSAAMALVAAVNPALSAPQIVSSVLLTAQDDVSGNGRDDQLGYGVVRADRAVAAALAMQSSGLAAGSKVRLRSLDASPEPMRRGQVATVRVAVEALYPDGVWRPSPLPALVRFEFRPAGSRKYRVVVMVASGADGQAVMQAKAARSGVWRAKVRQPNGRWTGTGVDRIKVRR